jgi:hypothetical protein
MLAMAIRDRRTPLPPGGAQPGPEAPSAAVAFRSMDTAVAAGAFALGGVVVGGALDWVRASIARRQAAASERDQFVAALDAACIRLMTEARLWRTLDTPMAKLRQLGFGILGELPELPAWASSTPLKESLSDVGYGLIRWVGKGAAKSFLHQSPVALAGSLRTTLLPLLSEITVLCVRLSMIGDEGIKTATVRIGEATGAVLEHITEPEARYLKQQEEVQAALGQLRRARDAAGAHWWHHGRRRRKRR